MEFLNWVEMGESKLNVSGIILCTNLPDRIKERKSGKHQHSSLSVSSLSAFITVARNNVWPVTSCSWQHIFLSSAMLSYTLELWAKTKPLLLQVAFVRYFIREWEVTTTAIYLTSLCNVLTPRLGLSWLQGLWESPLFLALGKRLAHSCVQQLHWQLKRMH